MELSSLVSRGASVHGADAIKGLASEARQKTQQRLEKNVESAQVQLSAFGQVKSATAGVQNAAKNLQDNKQLASAEDAKKVAQKFVDAVNLQRETVNQVSRSDKPARSEQSAPLAGEARLRSATNDVRQAVEGTAGKNESALKQAGISVGQDGALKLDAKKFEQAFAANPNQVTDTLNRIGKEVAEVSAKQLSSNGVVGSSINKLTEKVDNLQNRQNDFQARTEQSQRSAQEQDKRVQQAQQAQAFALNGTNAYNKIFSY